MANVKLIRGLRYRVLHAAVQNPFAGVRGVNPVMKVRLLSGINENAKSRDLRKGEIITFIGERTGWGSDPGVEPWFRTDDGFEGEFFPSGTWGTVSDVLLAPMAEAA